ncbi:hypothetical protein [Flagellimonas lutimaris]|uniref:hypothetical protein n=1 Tax=Flagellimonas lutimaris TaxID=475082 RepID=UPI003F5CF7B6
MIKKLFFILSIGFILGACEGNHMSNDLDRIKTIELLTFILNDSSDPFMESECIAEKNQLYYAVITTDLRNFIKTELEIVNEEHLNRQLDLYRHFRLTKDLSFGKKVITENMFVDFKNRAQELKQDLYEWLNSICQSEFISVSKPIFNDSYDKALITVGNICGGKCGAGETRTYELKNDKWIIVKTQFEWIG